MKNYPKKAYYEPLIEVIDIDTSSTFCETSPVVTVSDYPTPYDEVEI